MSDSRRLVIRFQQLTEVPDWVWDRTDLEFLCVSDNRLVFVAGWASSGFSTFATTR